MNIKPVTPKDSNGNKILGKVVAQVLLNKQGRAAKICIIEGDKRLVSAAIATIKKWRYPKESIQKDLRPGHHKYIDFPVSYTFN